MKPKIHNKSDGLFSCPCCGGVAETFKNRFDCDVCGTYGFIYLPFKLPNQKPKQEDK